MLASLADCSWPMTDDNDPRLKHWEPAGEIKRNLWASSELWCEYKYRSRGSNCFINNHDALEEKLKSILCSSEAEVFSSPKYTVLKLHFKCNFLKRLFGKNIFTPKWANFISSCNCLHRFLLKFQENVHVLYLQSLEMWTVQQTTFLCHVTKVDLWRFRPNFKPNLHKGDLLI